jgi:hypothetical protein
MARPITVLTDSFKIFKDNVNVISVNVGDPDNLTVANDSDVVQAVNHLDVDLHGAGGGGTVANDLNQLSYVGTYVVQALNNIDAYIGGDSTALPTTAATIIGALNELDSDLHGSAGGSVKADLNYVSYNNILGNQNIVGAINAIDAFIGHDSSELPTTAKTIIRAIKELDSDLHGPGGGTVYTDLTNVSHNGTFIVQAINNIDAQIGDSAANLTTTASTIVPAINELDGEMGDSDISAITALNDTVKGALRKLHTEVGDISSLDVNAGENDATAAVDLVEAANYLDDRLDSVESLLDQAVLTTSDVNFNTVEATTVTATTSVITPLISRTGNLTLDVSGNVILDADGGNIQLKDGGTDFGSLTNSSGNLVIKSGTTVAATFDSTDVTIAGTITQGTTLNTVATTLGAAINEIHDELDSASGELTVTQGRVTDLEDRLDSDDAYIGGGPTALNTSATTLVGAINEHESQIGELSSLDAYFTGADADHITALNALAADIGQLFDSANALDQRIGALSNLNSTFYDSAGARASIVAALNNVAKRAVYVYDASGTLLN